MRFLIIAAVAIGSIPAALSAHPEGHDDEQFRAPPAPARIDIPQAARQAVVRLVSQARLHASWARVQPAGSVQRTRNGAQQWVVTFQNNAIRNAAQRRLYVIVRPDGTFVSANYRLT